MQRSAQVAPERPRLRRVAPPRALVMLLAIVTVVGLCWAFLTPPFQAPDETAHLAYVQSLAESFRLTGAAGRMGLSSDEGVAQTAIGGLRSAGYPQSSPPDWSRADEKAYLALERSAHPPSRTDGSGFTSATGNPPLYYLTAALPYLIDDGGTMFGRLSTVRLEGVLLLFATTVGAWLLAGEVFARRRLPQLACAAVAGLLPMCTFISTIVSPDSLLITSWTFALWLGARVINRCARGSDAAVLCAVTAAAVLTKATSYALIGPVVLALVFGCLRRPAAERRIALLRSSAAGILLAGPLLGWLVLARQVGGVTVTQIAASPAHPFNVRQFLSYMWQFYLPRLPFLTPVPSLPHLAVKTIWIHQLTGDFGWLDVSEPAWMYQVAPWVAIGLGVAVVALLARLRGPRRFGLLAFFGLTLLALLVLLHIVGYQALITGSGVFLQGRYLLPAIGLLGLAVGLVVARLPRRMRAAAAAVTVTGLLVWQVISLAAVLHAYYV